MQSSEEQARIAGAYPQFFTPDWRIRAPIIGGFAAAIALFVFGFIALDISWGRVWAGFGRLGEFVFLMLPPTYGDTNLPFDFLKSLQETDKLMLYVGSMVETLAIAFLGTLFAAIIALPFGFLAARNVIPNIFAHFAVRRFLDTIRSVDTLIWALIWINVVGLGPFAGILAVITSNFGIFGKLFSEALETADTRPGEGIISTGGSGFHAVRFGLLPQILPVFVSQVLYYFESNTRSATIIGIVGAGGIGQHLYEQIKILEWQHVSFLVLLVLVAVVVIDFISSRLRFAIIGTNALKR
ncbi:MAG: phosphonate ABC transporter, permease protein PhnE [Beijerinckiaceae bacterium]|nr:phosphonate ABC transporter, permease protein PhnE [Beijerinckiaceae bacterium]